MEDIKKIKVLAVVGPTASGKTSLAITIAGTFNGEVISCDSRQVYRKLDEGTAKVSKEEMCGIPHHLIDVADINTIYTATDFKRDAEAAIADITARGKLPIIAGGTFFYLDQLRGGSAAAPAPPNPALRARYEHMPTEDIYRELQEKDSVRASTIDQHNKRRLVRALEITAAGNTAPTIAPELSPYDFFTLGIQTEKESLRARFRSRATDWLSGPFEAEVRSLLADGISRDRLQEIGFEYLIMLDYIDGKIDDDTFIQKCIEKNWQYAKRQLTWLKRDESIKWINPDFTEAQPCITEFLNAV